MPACRPAMPPRPSRSLVAFGTLWPRGRTVLWIYALLIAVSRVVVTAHYPSDVLAGAVVGVVGALLVRRWFALRGLAFSIGAGRRFASKTGPFAAADQGGCARAIGSIRSTRIGGCAGRRDLKNERQ